jgi:inosose dehydratase
MRITLGTTPDSWGVWFPDEPRQTHWSRFLDEAAAAGYRWIELGPVGYLPIEDGPRLQVELDRRGLRVTAGTIIEDLADPTRWETISRQARKLGPVLMDLGAEYLVLIDAPYTDLFSGKQIIDSRLAPDEWEHLVATNHRLADLIEPYDLTLVFHPHAQTRIEYEGQIEEFLTRTDPKKVGLCLDVGHHAYLGGDPSEFMRRHASRIPYLHLKSVDPRMTKKVTDEQIPFAAAVAMGIFCEPDRGLVDFPALLAVLKEVGYEGWGMVEQDMFPVAPDIPLPIARHTREFLEAIGFGDREASRPTRHSRSA